MDKFGPIFAAFLLLLVVPLFMGFVFGLGFVLCVVDLCLFWCGSLARKEKSGCSIFF